MDKISEKIVKHKTIILIIGLILLIPALIGMIKTDINYNVLVYLPEDIETMKGQNILTDDFKMGAFSISVIENMNSKDILSLEEKIRKINGVEKVFTINDLIGTTIPIEILPNDLRDKVYKDNTTLLAITFKENTSNEQTLKAVEDIRNISEKVKVGGMSAMVVDTMNLSNKEVLIYIIIAVILCIIVLTLCLDSYAVPFILLLNIGIAILYNMGTNIFLGNISYITKAISAVLQLGVTTDFSIFLYHKYENEKKNNKDKNKAMAIAIKDTFISVMGSSLTTIAGFLALCTMTLLLGKDIGIVMAKGVLLGVICVITIFPALLLMCDKLIEKTRHKELLPEFNFIKNITLKHYKLILIIFLLLCIPAYIGNKNVNVYYNLSKSLPSDLAFNVANEEVKNKFDIASPSVILLDKNIKNNTINEMLDKINNITGINATIAYSKLSNLGISENIISEDIKNMLKSDKYQLVIITSKYDIATPELNSQIDKINNIVKDYDSNAIVAGEGPLMKDLIKISDTDFHNVNYTSIIIIFILMLFVLKSISLPIILVIAIEFAIFVNMSTFYFSGVTLPFIASIVIGTIQLGATIDYAILLTTKYLEKRKENDKFVSMKYALDNSVRSIITSGLCFFGATFGVGIYSKIDMIGSICNLIARGAIISMLVVILILPSLILVLDKLIIKTTMGFKKGNDKMKKKLSVLMFMCALIIPFSVSATNKNETVYSIINQDGNENTIVSEILENVDEEVIDESTLENIINVNGNEQYFKKDNTITWKANGNNIFYQGTTTKKLPIDISIKYYLNDKLNDVKNLNGKNGHIKIDIEYKNNDKHQNLYTPFVVTFASIIKGNATNISINNGKIIQTGNQNIAIGIAIPNLGDSLNIKELNRLNNIIIEYDTTSFENFDMYNAYSSNLFSVDNLKIFDKLDSFYSKMDTLSNSSSKLVNGSKELSNGMNKYSTNFNTYKNGMSELNSGTKKLSSALNELSSGTNKLNSSYSNINDGIISINSNINKLTTLATSLQTLKSGLSTMSESIGDKNTNNSLINGVYQVKGGITKLNTALNSIKKELNIVNKNDANVLAIVKSYYNEGKISSDDYDKITTMLEANKAITNSNAAEIDNASTPNITAIINYMSTGLDSANNGLSLIESGLIKIQEALNDMNNKLDITTLNQNLTKLSSGLNELENGSKTFNTYMNNLSNSTSKINNATTTLSNASNKVNNATKELYSATNTLNNGINTLSNSLEQFDSEGIQKLVLFVNNDLKNLEYKVKELVKLGQNYNTFTMKNKNMTGETKFIVKIEAN